MTEGATAARINISVRPETKELIDRLRAEFGVNVSSICDRAIFDKLSRMDRLLHGEEGAA